MKVFSYSLVNTGHLYHISKQSDAPCAGHFHLLQHATPLNAFTGVRNLHRFGKKAPSPTSSNIRCLISLERSIYMTWVMATFPGFTFAEEKYIASTKKSP